MKLLSYSILCCLFLLSSKQKTTSIYESIEKITIKENQSYEHGEWYFNPNNSDINKTPKGYLSEIYKDYDFYTINLEIFFCWNITNYDCLVLHRKSNGELLIVPPISFSGINHDFIEKSIGYNYKNKKELKKVITQFQSFLLIGSEYSMRFINTQYKESKVTFELVKEKDDDVWRNIEIGLSNNKITYFTSTNPFTKEEVVIQ